MELPDLVRAVRGRPGRLALVLRFLVLGGIAFGAKRLVVRGEASTLVVEVPADAGPLERERALEEAMLLDVAERARLPQVDAVVRERVVKSLAVVEDVSDGNAAVARGVALGLHRQDTVARERLLADARELLFATAPAEAPTDDEARTFLDANSARYTKPAVVQFRQLFLSRAKRGTALIADAADIERRLRRGETPDGDAWAWTSDGGHYSEARLDALAGAGFGALVMKAPVGGWSGPIESSFGLHFVWVTARTAVSAMPLAVALPKARADLAAERREQARAARMGTLRAGYRVSWVRR